VKHVINHVRVSKPHPVNQSVSLTFNHSGATQLKTYSCA